MIATCKDCDREIQVEPWSPLTDGYVCPECQARFEGSFFRHLIQKRIENKDSITCIAGQDLGAGDLVTIYEKKRNWFCRLIMWAFKVKPTVYKVTNTTETTVDIHSQ